MSKRSKRKKNNEFHPSKFLSSESCGFALDGGRCLNPHKCNNKILIQSGNGGGNGYRSKMFKTFLCSECIGCYKINK